jgi:hypothetical protein
MPVLSTVGGASLRAFGAFLPFGSTATFISATGGTVTTSGNYKYHTFTSSSTFSVASSPTGKYFDFLIVGGGGGGGVTVNGTGGGGGGVIIKQGISLAVGSYDVEIGIGGDSSVATNGGNSVFAGNIAIGGGAGGVNTNGKSGGSGGGSDTSQSPYSAGAGLQPTSAYGGYGNNGTAYSFGGGGGGAGGTGTNQTGGVGISGSPLSSNLFGSGGNGYVSGVAAAANSGGGGSRSSFSVYDGASGIFIVRYLYQ